MKILALVFCNTHTGMGHWFRSITVAQQARSRGHQVFIASDRKPPDSLIHLPVAYGNPYDLEKVLDVIQPDWLVVDLPHTLPPWIEQMARCRICVLNGIGYDQANNIDLRVIQGVADLELPQEIDTSNTVMGIEYVVLRPELEWYKSAVRGDTWFVWGGAADSMSLLNRFGVVCPDWLAMLATVDMTPKPFVVSPNHFEVELAEGDESVFSWMAGSKVACIAMGMVVYELLYLGVKTYCFNFSDIHLLFSQVLERQGLIKSYPAVGLPDNETMRDFLEQPFEIEGRLPDLDGAKRIVKEMERR